MKHVIFVIALVIGLSFISSTVEAKGCLKGAAVSGVGGHLAGGHGRVGAGAGCLIGRHMANKKAQQEATQLANANAAQKNSAIRFGLIA